MKFTVKRGYWLRGDDIDDSLMMDERSCLLDSYLYRSRDKKFSCLGFLALELGADIGDIYNVTSPPFADGILWPEGILKPIKHPELFDPDNSSLTWKIIEINDDSSISDLDREIQLKEQFAKLNIDVEFED